MDAALPPETGSTTLASDGFYAHLASLADEHGVLPPWTRWWPRDDLAGVIPRHVSTSSTAAALVCRSATFRVA